MASTELVLFQLLLLVPLVTASHFFGGTTTFSYKGTNPDGTHKVVFRNRDTYDGCYFSLYWYCYSGFCGYTSHNSQNVLDRSTNTPQYNSQWCEVEHIDVRNLNSDQPFTMKASSCCWVYNRYGGYSMGWELQTLVDFGIRSDTRKPNQSPDIAILPVMRVPQNCPRAYKLASFDPDNDRVRCRYGNPGDGECNTCYQPPGFHLDQDTCTLHYQSTSLDNYVTAFEMVVEDYPHGHITMFYSDGTQTHRHPLYARRRRAAYATNTPPSETTPPVPELTTANSQWWWWQNPVAVSTLPTVTTKTTGASWGQQSTIPPSKAASTPMPTTTQSWWWWPASTVTPATTARTTNPAPPPTSWWWWPASTVTPAPTTNPAPPPTSWWWWPASTVAPAPTTNPAPPPTSWWWWPASTVAPATTARTTNPAPPPTSWWWWPASTVATTARTTNPAPPPTSWWWWPATTVAPAPTTNPAPPPTSWWWWLPATTVAPAPTTNPAPPPTSWWWWLPATTVAPVPTTNPAPPPTSWWWWLPATTVAPATAPQTTTTFLQPSTTVAPTTTTQRTTPYVNTPPLSKLPLQFSFFVDPPAPTCEEGIYLPRFVSPTPENGAHISAMANKELEIRIKAEATHSLIQDLLMSGPTNITKHKTMNDEFVIRWTPVMDDVGDYFPICFAVESATGSALSSYQSSQQYVTHAHSHYTPTSQSGIYQTEMRCVFVKVEKEQMEARVTCTETSMKVEIDKTSFHGLQPDQVRLSDPTNTDCSLEKFSNSTHIVGIIPLNACGTQIEEDDENLYFKNEITTDDDSSSLITRKHLLEAKFCCQYPKKGNVTLGFTVHRNSITVQEKGFGTFTYQLEFYPDAQFTAMIDPNSYPLEYDVGDLIDMQIDAVSSVNDTVMFVESCRAAPYDNPSYQPTYSIIENGCAVDPTVLVYSTDNDKQFRFSVEAFKFIGLHDQVYISCSVMMCEAGNPNTRCSQGCVNSTANAHYHLRKREAVTQSAPHFVSQGPLRLRRAADSRSEAAGLNLNMNLVFMAACLLAAVGMICGAVVYKTKTSKHRYRALPLYEN